MTGSVKERFDAKWTPEPFSGCWLWTAASGGAGYGQFSISPSRSDVGAHRVSWELYRGPIPPGLYALHHCDTKCCVNPDHLYLGTAVDNALDASRKGLLVKRAIQGELNPVAKLRESDIRHIRTSGESYKALAQALGVCESQISKIRKRTAWNHIP